MSDRVPTLAPHGVRRWLSLSLALGGYALSAALYSRLGGEIAIDLRRLLPVPMDAPTDVVGRPLVAFALPTLALLLWALLHDAPVRPLGRAASRLFGREGTRPAEFEKFAPAYRLIVAWVVALVLSLHVAVLAAALAWPVEPGTIVGAVFGTGLLLAGNEMPRLRPNAVAGIRTARTLRDPQAWGRAHRRYGALWVASGLVVLVVAAVAPRYALAAGLAMLLLSSLAMLAVSAFGDRESARATT